MLLMVEKVIRGRICHAIHRYAEENNKYMKNYENIHKFNEDFIKNYDENSHEGYILEVDVECPKKLIFIVICHFYPNERKSKSVTSLLVPCKIKRKLCCTYNTSKTGIKSWINTTKSTI